MEEFLDVFIGTAVIRFRDDGVSSDRYRRSDLARSRSYIGVEMRHSIFRTGVSEKRRKLRPCRFRRCILQLPLSPFQSSYPIKSPFSIVASMVYCSLQSLIVLLFLLHNISPLNLNRRTFVATTATIPTAYRGFVQEAHALPLFEQRDRRQLELCIVNVLRVQYWARNIVDTLQNADNEEQRKKAYLEARLGAKAMVADKKVKIGGGSSLFVITLRGLQMKEVLDDLRYYAKSKQMDQYKDDLVEALASLVEFDGLETTQDPSPRSSLTMAMYNNDKSVYVRRMLSERITPLTDDIVNLFGQDERRQCLGYVEQYYPNELPRQRKAAPEIIMDTVTEEAQ